MTTTAKHRRHMGMTLSERLTAVTVPVTSLKTGDVIVDSFHHRSTVTADARVVRGLVEVGLSGYDYAYDQSETVLRISATVDVFRCERAGDHLIATRHRRDECPFADKEN